MEINFNFIVLYKNSPKFYLERVFVFYQHNQKSSATVVTLLVFTVGAEEPHNAQPTKNLSLSYQPGRISKLKTLLYAAFLPAKAAVGLRL